MWPRFPREIREAREHFSNRASELVSSGTFDERIGAEGLRGQSRGHLIAFTGERRQFAELRNSGVHAGIALMRNRAETNTTAKPKSHLTEIALIGERELKSNLEGSRESSWATLRARDTRSRATFYGCDCPQDLCSLHRLGSPGAVRVELPSALR